MQRGAAEGEKVRAELEAKYTRMGEEEKERITQVIEEKAKQRESEARAKLDEYGNLFRELEQNMQALAGQKMAEWDIYKQQAREKNLEILMMVIDSNLEDARQAIEVNRALLDEAQKYGRNLPSVDTLL